VLLLTYGIHLCSLCWLNRYIRNSSIITIFLTCQLIKITMKKSLKNILLELKMPSHALVPTCRMCCEDMSVIVDLRRLLTTRHCDLALTSTYLLSLVSLLWLNTGMPRCSMCNKYTRNFYMMTTMTTIWMICQLSEQAWKSHFRNALLKL